MNMNTNLAHELPIPQGKVVQFPKKERTMPKDKFDKGYVMSSRLYRNEVEPFLSDAAVRVYMRLENHLNGFNKESDFISYSQLQGDSSLIGSRKLARSSISRGLKELLKLGVISVVGEHKKYGYKYKINEISLAERYRNATSSETLLVAKHYQVGSETLPSPSSETLHTIDIIYRYINIDKSIKSLRSNKPLENNFLVFRETQKMMQLEQQKIEAEKKAKAEKERKEKSRKLEFDEVIKLTKNTFAKLCDLELWEQYVSNRSTTSKTKLTKNALNLIYKDFVKWGYNGSNESLKNSINANYQGLFEPKNINATPHVTQAKQSRDEAWAEYYLQREQPNHQNMVDVQGVTYE